MPDTATYSDTLVGELREKIKDTSWSSPQFSIQAANASTALLEVTEDALITTITGGSGPSAPTSQSLLFSSYETIESLYNYIRALPGYVVYTPEEWEPKHRTTDIAVQHPISILSTPYQVKTRRWSDAELTNLLTDALRRHNLSVPRLTGLNFTGDYDFSSLPEQHRYFVVLLGQIEILKTLIHDSTKRRGTDLSVSDYDTLKRSLELEYESALDRLIKSVDALPPVELTEVDNGNIVFGHSFRIPRFPRSARRNNVLPAALAAPPQPSVLTATALGSGRVLVEWTRSMNLQFAKYELWRGDTPEVANHDYAVIPVGLIDFDGTRVHTQSLQYRTSYLDGVITGLTAGTYYYRLYTYDRSGFYAASDSVAVVVT